MKLLFIYCAAMLASAHLYSKIIEYEIHFVNMDDNPKCVWVKLKSWEKPVRFCLTERDPVPEEMRGIYPLKAYPNFSLKIIASENEKIRIYTENSSVGYPLAGDESEDWLNVIFVHKNGSVTGGYDPRLFPGYVPIRH